MTGVQTCALPISGEDGGEMVRYMTESPDLYIFSREKDNSRVIVFANLGSAPREVKYVGNAPVADATTVDFFAGEASEFPTSLNPGEYRVYVDR